MAVSKKVLKGFDDAAQSLKLYRRAELRDRKSDELLIGKLYVDPLQNNSVLETMLRPNTTFIIGRKGSGKSTVFQRAQDSLRQQKHALSAYIDIKTVYESSEVDPAIADKIAASGAVLPENDMRRLLLYRAFCKAVFLEVQTELRKQVESNIFTRVREKLASKRTDVIESIDELLDGSFESEITDIAGFSAMAVKANANNKEQQSESAKASVKAKVTPLGATLEGAYEANEASTSEHSDYTEYQYTKLLLRTINVTAIMEKLAAILKSVKVNTLYVFVDDFSELPQEAMTVFVDTILAPLNNWSNELIKFKVAAYPGRIYLGKIDKTKIDEVYLDIFRLYGSSDVTSMENKAIDFTRRLIDSRISHFLERDFAEFCEPNLDEVYRHLFYATMGNARILGHILHNLKEAYVGYDKLIGVRAVQEAAAKYYEEKIEPYFGIQKFSHEAFDERSSIFSLKELLETLVERARELRNYKDSTLTQEIKGRTPSSHFHIVSSMDTLLSTLELNFFLTKFFEMKDRDGRKVSVFALNYGLCGRYTIAFGRPKGRREHRTYFIERIFDYTPLLTKYLEDHQEIRCSNPGCAENHGLDKLESIKIFGMMCPKCKKGECIVTNLSRKYETILHTVGEQMLLPPTELGILETLFVEKRPLRAAELALELDCSYQLVGKRGRIMADRGLVARGRNERNRRIFNLTDQARDQYFSGNKDRSLDIPDDPEDGSN